MIEDQKSYRQIFKATSLFGGVQVFNIFISIIRSKFIAVLLGPTGMGIVGLLNSTIGLIGGLTNFGIGTSAVKDVASANESKDKNRISIVVTVIHRMVWLTGIIGSVVTLILSPWLSRLTFGNKEYTLAFVWLSITLLFSQLTNGQNVLLQGMRKLQYMAKASLMGSFVGLIVSVPIYFFLGINGIVPATILSSISSLAIARYFAAKFRITKVKITSQETILEGKGMMKMGFLLSMSGLITLGASYVVRIFINNKGGVADVGLYTAGFAIVSTYVGLVFTAMGTDYYPRLSEVAHNNKQTILLVNQQAEVAVLILAPIINVFLIFIKGVVILLYSSKFTPASGMIHWAALGMYFKAASWSVAFILLAKGASKLYFWNELIANIYTLGLNILGYQFFGLDGLGISFLVGYIIYTIQISLLTRRNYGFFFNYEFYKILGLQLFFGILCFSLIRFIPPPWTYITGLPIICLSAWISFMEIDKRMGLKTLLRGFLRRFNYTN